MGIMTQRPFRFGIVGTATDLAGWTALARRAEDAGRRDEFAPVIELLKGR